MKVVSTSILKKALFAASLILLPVIVVFAITYVKSRQYLKANIMEDLTIMVEAYEGQVYQFLEMLRRRAADFAADLFIRQEAERLASGGKDTAALSEYLTRNKLPLDRRLSRIGVYSMEGRVMASTDRAHTGEDVSGEQFFKRAASGIDTTEWDADDAGPEIVVLTKVLSTETGVQVAWLANFIHLSGIGDVLSGQYSKELGAISWHKVKRNTMEVYLVNRDRRMITGSRFVNDAVLRQKVDTLPVGECIEHGREVSDFYTDYRGVEVAGASMCLPKMQWTLLAEVDASEILAPLMEMRRDAFMGGVVVVGFIGALLAVFYRTVLVRLRLLSGAAASMAAGDYDVSVPPGPSDEIGVLSESFNAMAAEIKDRTAKLRESEERLRAVIDNSTAIIYLKDAEGRYILVNRRYRDIFGLSEEEIIGHDDSEIFPPDVAGAFMDNDLKVMEAGRPMEFEEPIVYGGELYYYLSIKVPLVDASGAPFATCCISSDITGRKAAEERVSRLNRLYSVLSKINEAIVRIRDVDALQKEACRIGVEEGGFVMCWIGALDDPGDAVTPVAWWGYGVEYLEGLSVTVKDVPEGRGPTGTAVREGRLVVSNDIERDGRMAPWRARALGLGFRSSAALPLFQAGRAAGVINLYASEPYFFNEEETKLLESMAADISFAMDSIEKERHAREADRELHLLQSLSLAVREAKDFHSALDVVLTGLCRATGWSLGEAWLPRKGGRTLEYALSCGCGGRFSEFTEESRKITFEPGAGVQGRVWATRRPLWIPDITLHGYEFRRAAIARKAGLKAQFGIPILDGGEPLAVVIFFMTEAREEDRRLIDFVTVASAQLGPVLRSKLAEEARAEIQQRYEGLVNNLTIGVYRDTQGGDGHIVEANPAAVEILEAPSRDELLKHRMSDFYADPGTHGRLTSKMLDQGFIRNEEVELVTFSGRRLWASITAVMKKDAAGQRYFDGIIEDITGRKRLEDQLRQAQKMEAVGQLAGGIAHDFNNILTALIGYGNLLIMKRGDDAVVRGYAKNMLGLSEKASSLTRGLLAFSRKQVISLQPVGLNALVRRVESTFLHLIGEDVELKSSLPVDEVTIKADPAQIEHVFMNLATNARDAMPHGGSIAISVDIVGLDDAFIGSHGYGEPGRYALLRFADTGSGIDEEVKKRMFEPFFTTKEVGKGTGLGLSMVYGIIKQHRGFIDVESEPGKGTVFSIYLPLMAAASGSDEPHGEKQASRGTETILLAEDQKEVRDMTRSMLEEYGYRVVTASDGEEAVGKFMEHRDAISLVVLDIIMPKKNGKEVWREIRKVAPNVRALFISGYSADAMKGRDMAAAAEVDFISKPVSPVDFLAKVREVIER
ncbi:MAG: GAF domain-containing protein [Thermodesulfobacteriota bacterium]